MNIQKINKWIAAIIYEDGDKMHPGSLKTLQMIKNEIASVPAETSSYADAEATLKHIILGGIADGHPKPEKQVDAIAENLFKPETLWCIKMLLQRHSA